MHWLSAFQISSSSFLRANSEEKILGLASLMDDWVSRGVGSRLCNLADETDKADKARDLKEDLNKVASYRVGSGFDRLEKRFEGKQKIEATDILRVCST
jgi:hypothetical protein